MTAKLAQLTQEQIVEKEKEFQLISADPKKAGETWSELHEFFKSATFFDVQKHWETYWRWYTELTWKRMNSLPKEVVINVAVALQIPMASMIGFDVWERLMWYFGMRTLDDEDLILFYTKVRDAFMNSKAFLGKSEGKDFTVSDLVQKVKNLGVKGDDSMELAEFYNKIRDIIKPQNDAVRKYIDVNPEEVVKDLTSLSSFFIAITPEQIPAVVDGFLHPELAEAVEIQKEIQKKEEEELKKTGDEMVEIGAENKTEKVESGNNTEKKEEPKLERVKEVVVGEEKNEVATEEIKTEEIETPAEESKEKKVEEKVEPEKIEKVEEKKEEKSKNINPVENKEDVKEENKMSLEDIKKMVESRFADKNGNIENIEGVFTLLNSLADDQKNEKIRELYYFDEEKGDFTWSI